MKPYIYTCIIKESGVPVSDIAFSRSEARDMKATYETLYKKKCSIVRYTNPNQVR